jgi:hypothetical protein
MAVYPIRYNTASIKPITTINTGANAAGNGITQGTLRPSQTGIVFFGFGVSANANTTVSGFNLYNTYNEDAAQAYFNNGKLYRSSSSTFSIGTATLINGATVTFGYGPTIGVLISGLSESISSSTTYYFIVGDFNPSYYGTLPATSQFRFLTSQTNPIVQSGPSSGNITVGSNVDGTNFSLDLPTLTITGLNSSGANNITTTVNPGELQKAFFGFKIAAAGTITINNINVNFPAGSSGTYFANAKLYASTDDVYSSATDTPIGTVALNGGNLAISGLTEIIANTSKSYFLAMDVNTFNNSSSPSTVYFRFASGQGQAAFIQTSPYKTFNTYNVDGSTLTMPPNSTFIWTGSSNNTNFNDNSNWANFGFPTITSDVTIPGGRTYYPVITANTSIGSITFSGLTPRITVNSGFTLTPSGNIIAEANSTPSILGPGSISSSSNLILNTGSVLTFTAPITLTSTGALTNAGTINVATTALSVAGASTNSGTINQTGAAAIAFSSTLNNTGTITQSSGGTFTATGAFTNSGSIAQSSTGTINITNGLTNTGTLSQTSTGIVNFNGTTQAINNNGVTALTFKNVTFSTSGTKTLGGTGSFSVMPTGTLTMAGTATLAAAGKLTLKSDAGSTASVAVIPSGTSITGDVTVERFFTGGSLSNRGWRLMSFPVNTTTTLPVTSAATSSFTSLKTNLLITGTGGSASGWDQPSGYTANGPTILFYNNAGTGSFTIPTTFASTTSRAGQGFYFYFRGNRNNALDKVVRSGPNFATPEAGVVGLQTGTLNQQNFTYTLSNAGTGYNLVGNPYPSSISVTSGALTGTTGFVYTFTPGGNSITSNSTPITIGSGQGFFVKSNNVTSSIAFSEAMKTASQPLTLLMGVPVTDPGEGNVKLQMVQDSANYDVAQLRFADNYISNYVDTEDADDLNGSGQTVFFGAMTADKRLVGIASQPLDKKKTSVFLSVNDSSSGTFSIKKEDISNIPDKYDVWLMDHFKKDSLNLRADSTYNFNLDKSNPLTFGDARFEVVIRIKDLPKYQLTSFSGKRSQGANLLQWNVQNEYTYTYFELERSFDNKTFEGVNNSMSTANGNYTFTDRGTSNPVVFYRLKQTDIYGNTYTSNIIIRVEDEDDKVFSVYPNPASDFLNFDIKEEVKGNIIMSIYNSVGRMVKTSSHSSNTGQENVSSLLPGPYTVELIDNGTKKRLASTKFIKQ